MPKATALQICPLSTMASCTTYGLDAVGLVSMRSATTRAMTASLVTPSNDDHDVCVEGNLTYV